MSISNPTLLTQSQRKMYHGANRSLAADRMTCNQLNATTLYNVDATFDGDIVFGPTSTVVGLSSAVLPQSLKSIEDLEPIPIGQMLYTTGQNVFGYSSITSDALNFIAQSGVANQQSVLSLVPGTNVQTQNALLQSLANQTASFTSQDLIYRTSATTISTTPMSAFAQTLLDDADNTTARTTLDVPQKANPTTNTAVALWSGATGDALLNSGVLVDGSNNVTGVTSLQTGTLDIQTTSTVGGNMVFSSGTISGIPNPSSGSEVANKTYVDAVASSGAAPLAPVQFATAAALPNAPNFNSTPVQTLTSTAGAGTALAVDGVTLVVGDNGSRVLVKDQANPHHNGIYDVTDYGGGASNWQLTRSSDFRNASSPIAAGSSVLVDVGGGGTNDGTTWTLQSTVSIADPTTDDVVFIQTGTGQTLVEGNGINIVGSTISVETDGGATTDFSGTQLIAVSDSRTFTNSTFGNTNTIHASHLQTTGASVNISGAAPPSAGQALVATGATTAEWQNVAASIDRQYSVAQSGGDYTTITAAIAALPAVSAANPFVINVYPGTYTEPAIVTVPSFVTVRGIGKANSVIVINGAGIANDVIHMSPASACIYITVQDAQAAVGFYYNAVPGNATARLENCSAVECDIGFHAAGTGAAFSSIMVCRNCTVQTTTITGSNGFLADNGGTLDCVVTVVSGFFGGNINVGYESNGASSLVILAEGNANFVNSGYLATNSSGSGNAELRVYAGTLSYIATVAINLGIRSTMRLFSVYVQDDTAIFPNQLHVQTNSLASPNASFIQGSGLVLRTDLTSINLNTEVSGNALSNTPGEVQNQFLGELIVGFPNQGYESVFGEGDSQTFRMSVYRFTGATAGSDGTYQDDITSDLKLDDGTTVSPFFTTPGAIGDAVYIGQDISTFPGITLSIDTGIVPAGGVGSLVFEYWNGAAWTEFHLNSTNRNAPYEAHNENIFDLGGYQYLFGSMTGWTQNTLTGDPATYNAFWMRFRVTAVLTTNPIIDQIKLHTNRLEINKDGFVTRYGTGRVRNRLRVPNSSFTDNGIDTFPPDQALVVSSGPPIIRSLRPHSLFANGITSAISLVWEPPREIDTSLPLSLHISWSRSIASAGNIYLQFDYAYSGDEDVIGNTSGSVVNPTQQQHLEAYPTSTVNRGQFTTVTDLDISTLDSENQTVWLTMKRLGGDALDTYTRDIYLIEFSFIFTTFKDGEYVQ